jgi:hypothetical protein
MYMVTYASEQAATVRVGRCVVTGTNEDDAIVKASYHLGIDASHKPRMSAVKLKPQVYQISEDQRPVAAPAKGTHAAPASSGFKSRHLVSLAATVEAVSKTAALRRLAHCLLLKCANDKAEDKGVRDFTVDIEVTGGEGALRQPAIAKQAIYKEATFYNGAHKGVSSRTAA